MGKEFLPIPHVPPLAELVTGWIGKNPGKLYLNTFIHVKNLVL
jgi:hypothetical protein